MTAPTATLPPHLAQLADAKLRDWLRTQPATVAAVVDLALIEDNALIVSVFAPGREDVLAEISTAVEALDDESTMTDREWLTKWAGSPGVGFFDAAALVERLCEDHRAAIQYRAQLVASTLTVGRVAA